MRLGNALLDLKASLVGLADTEMREEWKFGGRPPVVLEGAGEEEVLDRLRMRGAAQVILTRASSEAARLRKLLGTELVFTISDAKGLEFDTVLLWRFAGDAGAEAVWRSIASGDVPDEGRIPHVRHELALLYVAVTRTRSTLLVWDGETSAPVWTAPGIAPLVFRTRELDRLSELWKTISSPADWEKEGDYYFDRERYAAARECYRNAASEAKAQRAHARVLYGEGDHLEAAPLFERLGEPATAAECWERAGRWAQAERSWRQAGDPRRAQVCSARLAEEEGRLEEAAAAWEALGDHPKAESLWKRAGAFDRLARSAFASGRYAEAGELFERARMGREAAAAWEKAKQYERAGDLVLRLGEHAAAARLYHKNGTWEKELRCLRQLGRHHEAGLILEKQGEIEKAIEAFAQAAAESTEARSRLESEVPQAKTRPTARKAGVRLAALGRNAEAAEMLLKAGAFDAAARCYERAGDRAGVARCHEHAGRWLEAARELGRAKGTDEVRRCAAIQQLLYRHVQSARRQGREQREVQALVREAPRLAEEGNLVAALARYRLCGLVEESVEISRGLGWHETVIDWLLASGHASSALKYVKQGGFEITAGFYGRMAAGYLEPGPGSAGNPEEIRATLSRLLASVVDSLPAEEARRLTEDYFEKAYGSFPSLDRVQDEDLSLLFRTRASAAIISLLGWEMRFLRDPGPRLRELGQRLGREAVESGDPGMNACRAYFSEMMRVRHTGDGFEAAAAQLPLARGTAAILGLEPAALS